MTGRVKYRSKTLGLSRGGLVAGELGWAARFLGGIGLGALEIQLREVIAGARPEGAICRFRHVASSPAREQSLRRLQKAGVPG